jgi:ubiquinol-cytochrome c reductase cytochrome c subunit
MNSGHAGNGIRRRVGRGSRSTTGLRPLAGWVAATGLGLAIVALAAPSLTAQPIAAQSTGTVTDDAATLYLQNCASCHGPQGEGTGAGPSLQGVGAAAADFYLSTGRMPLGAPGQRPIRQAPKFDQAQIAALVAYVASFGGGPDIPQVSTGGDVHRGFELYNANCAACHAATGAGNAVGGGFFAVGLGQATDQQIGEAMIVGPGVMPKFAITGADRDALVAYIRYLRSAPTPGGAPIGGIGPVAEGFVAVVIGLSALALAAAFVGRRHRDDHGPERDEAAAHGAAESR